jgi:hypothetical protein
VVGHRRHLLAEGGDELLYEDGSLTFGARATQPERTAADVTVRAAALADEMGFAVWAPVDRGGDQRALAPQGSAQGGQVGVRGLGRRRGARMAAAKLAGRK